jgi:hypothetical protein
LSPTAHYVCDNAADNHRRPSTARKARRLRRIEPFNRIVVERETVMAKYGGKAKTEVKKAMHERKRGKLKSGTSGKKVTSRKQAIAIGLSKARRKGGKVPAKKK